MDGVSRIGNLWLVGGIIHVCEADRIMFGVLLQGATDICQSLSEGAVPPRSRRAEGGLDSRLYAICDSKGSQGVVLLELALHVLMPTKAAGCYTSPWNSPCSLAT